MTSAENSAEPGNDVNMADQEELEADAATDTREKIEEGVAFFSEIDSTLNVMPTAHGSLLMTLGDGGMQYLLAGARATVGVSAGRYFFEVRIAELLSYSEPSVAATKGPAPRQLARVGMSLVGSSLFLGDTQDNICFDSDGFFTHNRKRLKVGTKFGAATIGLLVNLEDTGPNAFTVSLFKDGVRASEPQTFPDSFRGKALFPTVTFRSATLEVNFGPAPRRPLPFECRMVGDAAADDVVVVPGRASVTSEVIIPVGLPGGGFFDWIDCFLAKNPGYTEISNRKILEWAVRSGMARPKGAGSNDKPCLEFGIPLMDDGSVRRMLMSVAPTLRRNYVIGELQANLVPTERAKSLSLFSAQRFKKHAVVIMGDPSEEYSLWVSKILLAEKLAEAAADKKRKAASAERERLLAEKKRKAEESRRAKLVAQKRKEGGGEEDEDEQELAGEKMEVDEAFEDSMVELTEEEKKIVHRRTAIPDVGNDEFGASFMSYALPEMEEGFDEITYEWQSANQCTEAIRRYQATLKLTHLEPSAWFKEKYSAWEKLMAVWKRKALQWKDPVKREAFLVERGDALAAEGNEDLAATIDMEELDVMGVEDVNDVGNGEPLFANFEYEDWILLSTRYEIHLLLHAFRKDVGDSDRQTFKDTDLAFYYEKYFGKQLKLSNFACSTFDTFFQHIQDVVAIKGDPRTLETSLPEEEHPSHFVKLTEKHRRDRQWRVEAGDESVRLQFPRSSQSPAISTTGQSFSAQSSGGIGIGVTRPRLPSQLPASSLEGSGKGSSGIKGSIKSSPSNKGSGKKSSGRKGSCKASQEPPWKQPRLVHSVTPRLVHSVATGPHRGGNSF
eukprot:TRINITY_DN69025_c0_g1_i1.p1 TRINITY_DN69025_c0_g1~~TRINITY_DN69025_c0_g1_i1.p1  ORF type:complete len:841 (+),score=154.15 TRINITY_DN69025_c0_g1_i1:68-2590(+)